MRNNIYQDIAKERVAEKNDEHNCTTPCTFRSESFSMYFVTKHNQSVRGD